MFTQSNGSITLWFAVFVSLMTARAWAVENIVLEPASVEKGRVKAWLTQGQVVDVAVDEHGNTYVTGSYGNGRSSGGPYDVDDLDFDLGRNVAAVQYKYSGSLFVTRYNTDGSYAWTRTFTRAGGQEMLVVDGIVYLVGSFRALDNGFDGPGSISCSPPEPIQTTPSGSPIYEVNGLVLALDAKTGQPISTFGRGGAVPAGDIGFSDLFSDFHDITYSSREGRLYIAGTFAKRKSPHEFNYIRGHVVALDAHTGALTAEFGMGGRVEVTSSWRWPKASGVTVCDENQTVYVTGSFHRTDTRINGGGEFPKSGTVYSEAYVAALDSTSGALRESFGLGGVQTFGGPADDDDRGHKVQVHEGTLYCVGIFSSLNAGIGGSGAVSPAGGSDGFVLAMNADTGSPKPDFGTMGVQTFGGSLQDHLDDVLIHERVLYVCGWFQSYDAGVGGSGDYHYNSYPSQYGDHGDDDVFVLALNPYTGMAYTSFGNSGITVFGGTGTEGATGTGLHYSGLCAMDEEVFCASWSSSRNCGIDELGPLDANAVYRNPGHCGPLGFVLEMDAAGVNRAPTVVSGPTADPNPAEVHQAVSFTVTADDPDGNALSYTWDFGDGGTTGGEAPTHTYTANGEYAVTVTVTDGNGGSAVGEVVVTVESPGDLNGDSVVNIADLLFVIVHFGQTPTDPDWDPRADANNDEAVNVNDLLIVIDNFGKTYP